MELGCAIEVLKWVHLSTSMAQPSSMFPKFKLKWSAKCVKRRTQTVFFKIMIWTINSKKYCLGSAFCNFFRNEMKRDCKVFSVITVHHIAETLNPETLQKINWLVNSGLRYHNFSESLRRTMICPYWGRFVYKVHAVIL